MIPKMIKTEAEYREAQATLDRLMDAAPGSPEEQELELLAFLIENYEKEHFPIGLPDPIEAIKFRMEQQGLTRKDLEKYIGSQSKVSEVLNRKRPLSLAMIRALHAGLGISTEVLIQKTEKSAHNPQDDDFEELPTPAAARTTPPEHASADIQAPESLVNWPRLSETARRLMIASGLSAEVREVDEQLFARWVDDHLDQARIALEQVEYPSAIQYIRALRQGLEQLSAQSPLIHTYCQAVRLLEEQLVLTAQFSKVLREKAEGGGYQAG